MNKEKIKTKIESLKRQLKALEGLESGEYTVEKIFADEFFKVKNSKSEYFVKKGGEDYLCTCPDAEYRVKKCKHIYMVICTECFKEELEEQEEELKELEEAY